MSTFDDPSAHLFGRGPDLSAMTAATAVMAATDFSFADAPSAAAPAGSTPPSDTPPIPGLEAAIRACAPRLSDADIGAWVAALTDPMRRAEVTAPRRIAGLIGQCAVESGGLRILEENLNYSAQRLCQVWPGRFPTLDVATPYAHNPEKLANRVYANRIGNRDEESGDGWRFRGRGLIQLTGRANYERFARATGCDADDAADRANSRIGAAETAIWFWSANTLNVQADAWAIDVMTRKINGGTIAAAERRRLCQAALDAIGE